MKLLKRKLKQNQKLKMDSQQIDKKITNFEGFTWSLFLFDFM